MNLNGKKVLITGGTGSLGQMLVEVILEKWPQISKLIVFSRDEQKQFQMAQDFFSCVCMLKKSVVGIGY